MTAVEATKSWLMLLTALALASAGCVGAVNEENLDQGDVQGTEDEALQEVETQVVDGSLAASAATPAVSFNYGGAFSHPFTHSDEHTGWIVEVEWEASAPTNEELDVWIREEGAGSIPPSNPTDPASLRPLVAETGTSPVRVVLPADEFPAAGAYEVLVRAPSPSGVAVNQAFTLHVTSFRLTDFDADHSALDAGEHH